MEEAKNDLKRCVSQYCRVDDELRKLNKAVFDKREQRKIIEMEISDLIILPYFKDFKKLKFEDGSTISVQKPQEWSKPWSLSKKDLLSLLNEYFNSTQERSATGCYEFIVEEQKKKLVSTDYSYNRIVPEEEN